MTARQRGPPPSSSRSTNNPSYGYSRQTPTDEREALTNDPYLVDRYLNSRGGGAGGGGAIGGGGGAPRDFYYDTNDTPLPSPYNASRNRTDSNSSLPLENQRIPRPQHPSSADESRARGASMSSSPVRTYRDDNRPRSGHSNNTAPPSSREKIYFSADDFQPPQFPQNPYGATRHSVAIDSQEAAKRSRPSSRTQSPIPPYPSTPPPSSRSSPDHVRGRGNSNRQMQNEQDQKSPNHPFQLAPLKFSPPRAREESYSLLAGTQFDDIAASPENEVLKTSPPAPSRPPPAPPVRHKAVSNHVNTDLHRSSMHQQGVNDAEVLIRTPSGKDNGEEEWSLDQVIEFLRTNGFGEAWQQAFRDADIHGDKFRACASFPEAKKLVHVPQEAHQPQQGRTLFKLITIIRKVLNPDSDTPDSETSTPTPRNNDRPRRFSDHERPSVRRETLPATSQQTYKPVSVPNIPSPVSVTPEPSPLPPTRPTQRNESPMRNNTSPPSVNDLKVPMSNINIPSPVSPEFPALPTSARLAPRHSEQTPNFGPPPTRHEYSTPKLHPPPPPRKSSPQDTKRPLSPNVMDPRQPNHAHTPPNQFLGQYNNRHSKNFSNDSNLSDQSVRSNQPARLSQDFQDIMRRIEKDGTIAPQRRPIDKKKSHEQMSKPGIFSRFFQRDKAKEVVADLVPSTSEVSLQQDEQDDYGPMSPPLPPHPPYNNSRASGMNNSQSSLDSSALSTPIDDPRASLTTSISSLPNVRTTDPTPPQYVLPTTLWVQITQDGEDFRRCDLSNAGADAAIIRERVCKKFGAKPKETALYITDIDGTADDAEALDDDALLSACTRGDAKGTLKFLLKPSPSSTQRRRGNSPGKLIIPPAMRPGQGGMLSVPDADGRDTRSTSISEDPNRKGHYNTTPNEMYGADYVKQGKGDETGASAKSAPSEYFGTRTDEAEKPDPSRRESNVPLRKDDVNTRVFEAAERAKKNREGRKRTESGGSEKSTPLDETPHQFDNPLISPGGRRRPSAQEDPGFEKLWGRKVTSDSPPRPVPSRQQSLPMSPSSATGSFRVLTKDADNVLDFSKPRLSPYQTHSSAFENLSTAQPASQLPVRTPSGIKAQRRAPAPPQFPVPPSRNATVVATQRPPERPLPRGHRRSSDSQNTLSRRSFEDDRFASRGHTEFGSQSDIDFTAVAPRRYTPAASSGGFVSIAPPSIVTPSRSGNLEPMTVIPKRAPSPGTPGARLGITVNTNLGNHNADDSPPTEWQTSMSPYSGLKSSAVKAESAQEKTESKEPAVADADRFKESSNISFDDAPEFDLPDDDDEGSLWAVKPIGVEDSTPSNSRKNSEDKPLPMLRKKSSLRKGPGKSGNRPPLTVQIDDKITEIPTPLFSAIAEEGSSIAPSSLSSSMNSSIPSEGSSRSSQSLGPSHRADSPEFTVGDDKKGLNSPMRQPRSPGTPNSSTSAASLAFITDLTRKNSFAKHEDVWAVRPPPDVVLDNLEEFFPNHDLDKPILVDPGNLSPPVSPMDNSDSDTSAAIKPAPRVKIQPQSTATSSSAPPAAFPKPTARMKSIRVVAKEAIEKRSRLASIAKGVKMANLLRRKSTKVWGARMLEMTPGQVRLGQIVTADHSEDGLERKRIPLRPWYLMIRNVQMGQG